MRFKFYGYHIYSPQTHPTPSFLSCQDLFTVGIFAPSEKTSIPNRHISRPRSRGISSFGAPIASLPVSSHPFPVLARSPTRVTILRGRYTKGQRCGRKASIQPRLVCYQKGQPVQFPLEIRYFRITLFVLLDHIANLADKVPVLLFEPVKGFC